MAQRPVVVPLRGGLDLVSPAMMAAPGFAIQAKNYEVEARGYRRIGGYEPYDGQPSALDADYYVLYLDAINTMVAAGSTLTGATSGASGLVLHEPVLDDDSAAVGQGSAWDNMTVTWDSQRGVWDIGVAHGHIALYGVTGTFQDREEVRVGGVTVAVANGTQQLNAAPTPALHDEYQSLAQNQAAATYAAVPGSGPIRGVATYQGAVYAWRDNAGGTAGQMWLATVSGWVQRTFGQTLYFTSGATEFEEETTVTGQTSGATGTIKRVILHDGAWSGTASGYLVLSGVTGTFQNAENLQVGGVTYAVASGTNTAITLPAGGKYRAVEHNFFGQAKTTRLYAVNGVGEAFEWDGSVLAPIDTRASDDTPAFIAVHKGRLFLGFEQGSIIYSSAGEPLEINAITGAGEIAVGFALTNMVSFTRDALIITGKNRIGYLVGSSAADFDFKQFNPGRGAYEDTLAVALEPMFMDDQGVRTLEASERFGDWLMQSTTRLIEPLIRQKRQAGTLPVGAIPVRAKDQYRLFYNDGTGIVIYLGRGDPESMPFEYPFTPACVVSGELATGEEIILVGASDGWVYRLDRGSSFNGSAINALLRTSFLHQGAPNLMKRYHRAFIEGHASGRLLSLNVAAQFDYGGGEAPAKPDDARTLTGGGEYWTETFWNDPLGWGTSVEGQATVPLDTVAEDVSFLFKSSGTEDDHTLSVLTINWTPRRRKR